MAIYKDVNGELELISSAATRAERVAKARQAKVDAGLPDSPCVKDNLAPVKDKLASVKEES